MSLSCYERRELAAVERALSRDPVLRAVADLFPQPPARPQPRADRVYHRWQPALLLGAVLAGIAGTVVGAALIVPALLAVGLVALVSAMLTFAATAIRRGTQVRRRPEPALTAPTREGD